MQTPAERFDYAVNTVLKHEGGFSNHKTDPGGATIYGISLRYLKAAGLDINLDGRIDISDIMALDKQTAKAIYKSNWWDKYKYNAINDLNIAAKVFDLSVNMGATEAHKIVQRAINKLSSLIDETLYVDGRLGIKCLTAINVLCTLNHAHELLRAIKTEARSFYSNLVKAKPELGIFLKGWLRRADD